MKKNSENHGPVKLGVRGWAREFHLSEVTLRRALAKAGEQADERDLYATSQVIAALYTPTAEQRSDLLKAKTEAAKARTAEMAKGLIPVKEIPKLTQVVFDAIREVILAAPELSEHQKEIVLRHLKPARQQ